uniref:hypothetical protein n=1 Tax=Actinoplanes sp. CA-151224 TaxID=3239904 RepID=UPI003F4936D6
MRRRPSTPEELRAAAVAANEALPYTNPRARYSRARDYQQALTAGGERRRH